MKPHNRQLKKMQTFMKPKVATVKHAICSWKFIKESLLTVGLIILFYTFSISLTFYNQRFIHHFKFPLSITMVHLVTKFVIASLIRGCLSCKSGKSRITLGWKDFATRVAPPGIAASLDIGLSNWSFEFLTVSLYTMTKSTVIVFILIFSICLKLEKMRWPLVLVVLFISGGLFMFTFHSTQFNLVGFLLVLGASFLSGIRWTLSQVVLQKSEIGLSNPLDMIYHIQPWMIVALFPLSVGFESLHLATTQDVFAFKDVSRLLINLSILFAGAIVAFGLEFSEFLLLSYTSGITLSISGIFKEICTLYLATEINGDKMNWINIIGLVLCLMGIAIHVIMKATSGDQKPAEINLNQEDAYELLLMNGDPNLSDISEEEIDIYSANRDR